MFNPRENILFTLFLHAHFMTFMIFFSHSFPVDYPFSDTGVENNLCRIMPKGIGR